MNLGAGWQSRYRNDPAGEWLCAPRRGSTSISQHDLSACGFIVVLAPRERLWQPPESCVCSEDAAPCCLGRGDNLATGCHHQGNTTATAPWRGHGEGGPRHCQTHGARDEGFPWQSEGRQSVTTPASPTSQDIQAGAFFLLLSLRPAARTPVPGEGGAARLRCRSHAGQWRTRAARAADSPKPS